MSLAALAGLPLGVGEGVVIVSLGFFECEFCNRCSC